MGLRFYPESKLEALAKHLNVDANELRAWSDDSVTVGNNDNVEYYVSKRTLQREQIGTQDGYKIFKS